jgi:hypothetical protein
MSDAQLTGLSLLLAGALPCYLLAVYIQKYKHWSLFSGWDASRISDHDACGKMMCNGIKAFSLVMGLGGAFIFVTGLGGSPLILVITVFSIVSLMYYVLSARRLYWK